MTRTIEPDAKIIGAYVVREIDDGNVFVTTFEGLEADKRAKEYLDWRVALDATSRP